MLIKLVKIPRKGKSGGFATTWTSYFDYAVHIGDRTEPLIVFEGWDTMYGITGRYNEALDFATRLADQLHATVEIIQKDMAKLRKQALAKLTKEERQALAYFS